MVKSTNFYFALVYLEQIYHRLKVTVAMCQYLLGLLLCQVNDLGYSLFMDCDVYH